MEILYVEIDKDDLSLTLRAFKRLAPDIKVDYCYDGTDALEALKKKDYQLVMLDYMLPGISGHEMLKRILEMKYAAPIIMVTGMGDEELAVSSMKAGAYDYVVKSEGYLQRLPLLVKNVIERYGHDQEEKRIEQEVIRAREEAEFYLDLMSHDINNKNQVAILSAQMLMLDDTLNEQQKEIIGRIYSSVDESSRIIKNVKKLQRIKLDELKVYMIDLDDMIKNVVSEYTTAATKDLKIDYLPIKVDVYANDLLREVFTNLIDNAIKYSGDSVKIDIRVEEIDEDVRILLEDNGKGIDDELKERIFERLARGKETVKGSGLGLYVVSFLMASYGGSIRVEDRVKGDYSQGARFVISIPRIKKTKSTST